MTFNGVKKDYVVTLRGKRRPAWAPLERNMLYVPGRPGAYLESTNVKPRVLDIPILLESKNLIDLQKMKEDLASWLITDEPKELIFDDEPDRVYYAMVDGGLDIDEIISVGVGIVNFICPNPYKHTKEFTAKFENDFLTVRNYGTAEAQPIFEMEVLQPTTYAMIERQDDKYMMVGQPYDVTEELPYIREELSFDKTGNTLAEWSAGTTVDGGIVAGSFYVDGNAFRAKTYGANTSAWHGPSISMSLPELLTDFRVQTYFTVKSKTDKSFGRAELYLLNSGGQKIGKLAMKNIGTHGNSNVGEVVLRDETTGNQQVMIQTPGIRERLWNNFYGILRLERDNGVYKAYIAMVDTKTGQYHTAWNATFEDSKGLYNDNLASIQLHLGAYAGLQWIEDIAIHRVTVYKINRPVSYEVPYIAQPGDIIVFDMINENLLINGESRVELKDFGGEYFNMKPNLNEFRITPAETFKAKLRYRERYK